MFSSKPFLTSFVSPCSWPSDQEAWRVGHRQRHDAAKVARACGGGHTIFWAGGRRPETHGRPWWGGKQPGGWQAVGVQAGGTRFNQGAWGWGRRGLRARERRPNRGPEFNHGEGVGDSYAASGKEAEYTGPGVHGSMVQAYGEERGPSRSSGRVPARWGLKRWWGRGDSQTGEGDSRPNRLRRLERWWVDWGQPPEAEGRRERAEMARPVRVSGGLPLTSPPLNSGCPQAPPVDVLGM